MAYLLHLDLAGDVRLFKIKYRNRKNFSMGLLSNSLECLGSGCLRALKPN